MLVNKSLFPVSSNLLTINKMNAELANLQMQLATRKKHATLAEMGNERVADLAMRQRLGRIEGYQATIMTVQMRIDFYATTMTRLDQIEADARAAAVPGAYGTDGLNLVTQQAQAKARLGEVIDLLNADMVGRYAFGGNVTDRKPVAEMDQMIHGPNGFNAIVTERKQAHGVFDASSPGRVDIGRTDAAVTLSTDPTSPLGLQVAGGAWSHDFEADPVGPGTSLSVSVKLPAPSMKSVDVKLTATDGPPTGPDEFQVVWATPPDPENGVAGVVDPEATAAAFEAAMTERLQDVAASALATETVTQVADEFFDSNGTAVLRVQFDPMTGAPSGLAVGDAVQWYRGQNPDSATGARQTVSARIDENTSVSYGVQANEVGLKDLVKGLAIFTIEEFTMPREPIRSDFGAEADYAAAKHSYDREVRVTADRYEALVADQRVRLSEERNNQPGSIEVILMDLGLASHTLANTSSRQNQYVMQLETMLADIEVAPLEEVAMRITDLSTRLQASYQVTAMVSQLSLVNYLK